MSFSSQFKILIWKNWKVFKKESLNYWLFTEVFVVAVAIALIGLYSDKPNMDFDAVPSTNLVDNTFAFRPNSEGIIGFVYPKHQVPVSGDVFVNMFMADPAIQIAPNITSKVFEKEEDMVEFSIKNTKNTDYKFLAGIVFNDVYNDYAIRIKGSDITDPKKEAIINYDISRINEIPLNEFTTLTDSDYYLSTFVPLQMAIDRTIIGMSTDGKVLGYTSSVGKLCKPPLKYRLNEEESRKRSLTGYAVVIQFIFIGQMFRLCSRLMEEKENGTRKGLLSIGVHRSLLWMTWELIIMPLSIFLILFIMGSELLFSDVGNLKAINYLLVFLILFFYCISVYKIIVILTLMFNRFKTVLAFCTVALIALYKSQEFIYNLKFNGYGTIEKVISLLASPVGINMAFAEINHAVNMEEYITFSNMFKSDFGTYFIFLLIDAIVYTLITFLLDFLCGVNFSSIGINKSIKSKSSNGIDYSEDIQEDPVGAECYVEVKNVYKYFKFRRNISTDTDNDDKKLGKVFAANNNISFKVYKDEIFAILGHNGAGKSTLIKNMIGSLKPDDGEIYYGGVPISKNKKEIYSQFGICPQNNILMNRLTIAEHMKFYAGLKGVDIDDIDATLKDIDLLEKKNSFPDSISGGQKRKLCIGIAFIGNPKYVFLDEPTTGLDPLSRRKIWKLLLKKKKDRVIFITTHYMDEADIIADRKVIISKGIIRCLGSSVYMKNHFNMKYNLEVETSDSEKVGAIIQKHVPSAEFFNNKTTINEAIYEKKAVNSSASPNCYIWKLPIKASSTFSSLLKELEDNRGKIVKDFSLNVPMLEELFVRLERENEEKEDEENGLKDIAIELPNIDSIKRPGLYASALRLVYFRSKIYLRNYLYILMCIVFPFFIILFTFRMLDNEIKAGSEIHYEDKVISSDLYKGQQWNYNLQNSTSLNATLPLNDIQMSFPKSDRDPNEMNLDYLSYDDMEKAGIALTHEPYYVASFSGEYTENLYKFNVHYNDSMPHAVPATLNSLSNSILSANHLNMTIKVHNHPLNYFEISNLLGIKFNACFALLFTVALAFSFYASNAVYERNKGLMKQLQSNGMSNHSYWISLIITDYFWFLITGGAILLALIIIKFSPLFYVPSLVVFGLYFVIGSLSYIFLQYCLSFTFKNENTSYAFFVVLNILIYLYFIFNVFQPMEIDIYSKYEMVDHVNLVIIDALFPCYGFANMLNVLISLGVEHQIVGSTISFSTLFSMRTKIISNYIGGIISAIIYLCLLLYIIHIKYKPNPKKVYPFTKKLNESIEKEMSESDADVYLEYQRVKKDVESGAHKLSVKFLKLFKEYKVYGNTFEDDILKIGNQKKYKYGEPHISEYGSGRVVTIPFKNITLGVDKCECFGILGPNGSGKSSLLNTVSFTYQQSLGDIYYDGRNTLERKDNEITLGYCPQEDTLWSKLTLFEHIRMFLYIRGYSWSKSRELTKQFIRYCRIGAHKNKYPDELSGGTRRKLNILIALCCSSSKIILDEPTAGMDPSTRRYVWDVIKATIQNNQSSTIMSTHSMEEAELLCNRLTIMVNGKLQCIGSPEHIKMKYGNTYILDVHAKDVERFHHEIVEGRKLFGDGQYQREDKSHQHVKYEVTNASNISHIFEIMESCRETGHYEDYSYSQTSLEQVFLNFALLKEKEE